MSWANNPNTVAKMIDQVRKLLIDHGYLYDRPGDTQLTETMSYIRRVEYQTGYYYYRYSSPQEFLDAFEVWIHQPENSMTKETIKVTETRDYGAVQISFGLERTVYVRGELELKRMHQSTRQVLADLHEHYVNDALPKIALPDAFNPDAQSGALPAVGQEYHDLVALSHSVDDQGRHVVKGKCGPWTEYGVRIWPEVLKAAGLDHDGLPLGVTEMTGHCRVYMKEGKPRKITEIILDE
jgi:hypothetical protein